MSNMDIPEAMSDTPGPRKTQKDVDVQDVHSTSTNTTSISPTQGGDCEEVGGTKVDQNKGEVTLTREEDHLSKKMKISPINPSS